MPSPTPATNNAARASVVAPGSMAGRSRSALCCKTPRPSSRVNLSGEMDVLSAFPDHGKLLLRGGWLPQTHHPAVAALSGPSCLPRHRGDVDLGVDGRHHAVPPGASVGRART